LLVKISKWMRHQIRAHLSSIWYPIVWEKIYIKNPSKEDLHLYSIGIQIDGF
jgi:23S rRNA-/tRNA-specific pseudouridylate synthase